MDSKNRKVVGSWWQHYIKAPNQHFHVEFFHVKVMGCVLQYILPPLKDPPKKLSVHENEFSVVFERLSVCVSASTWYESEPVSCKANGEG